MFSGKKVAVVIAAAGSGQRMGDTAVNKVYLKLHGKTVLERSYDAFEQNEKVDYIITAVRSEDVEFCQNSILKKETHPKLKAVISGGSERYDTVYKALALVEDSDIVLVHDGARPLIDNDTINRCIKAAVEHGAAITGVPAKDTIKIVKNDFVENTLDRNFLYNIQTPQAFLAGKIKKYMKIAIKEGIIGTDEAFFAERLGKKVFIVEGKYDNIKITTSEDIIIAEALLLKKETDTAKMNND